jgi:hypothetical protein
MTFQKAATIGFFILLIIAGLGGALVGAFLHALAG